MLKSGKKIKVLHVVDSLGGGGVEESVKNICTLCDRDSFQFRVYFCGYIYDKALFEYRADLEKAGIEVIYRGIDLSGSKVGLRMVKEATGSNCVFRQIRRFLMHFFINIISFFHIVGIIKRDRPDVIHTHLYRLFISSGLAGRLFGIPVVHTVPGLKSQLDSYQPLIYSVYRCFNYLADIFVTGASKEELIRYAHVPERKVRFIKGSINFDRLKNIPREDNPVITEFNLSDSFPIVLSVGRMDPEKGHIYSIKAVKELVSVFPNIKFIALGDGSELENFRRLVESLGLEKHCVLPGFRSDVENFHSLSHIYLRTSIYEGVNMASLLAMAYGKPVVGFDTKAPTEVLMDGENGILVPPRDVSKLTEAIVTLANNKGLREKLGESARRYARGAWDIESTIGTYENIYDTIVKSK